jgi:hypothetical protein
MGISHCVKHCCHVRNIRKHCRRKVELNGLLYVIERLPRVEECRFINLTSDEGYSKSHFQAIIPLREEIVTV